MKRQGEVYRVGLLMPVQDLHLIQSGVIVAFGGGHLVQDLEVCCEIVSSLPF